MKSAKLIDRLIKEVVSQQVRRKITIELKHSKGQNGKEQSLEMWKLPAGSPVLVYHTKSKRCEVQYTFIYIDGETVPVQLDHGRRMFRSTCVKPFASPLTIDSHTPVNVCSGDSHAYWSKWGEWSVVEQKTDIHIEQFTKARLKEIRGLMKNGIFEMVDILNVEKDTRLFGSQFLDQVKPANNALRYRSWLDAQNYSDDQATTIVKKYQLFNGSHNASSFPWLPRWNIRILTFETSLMRTSSQQPPPPRPWRIQQTIEGNEPSNKQGS